MDKEELTRSLLDRLGMELEAVRNIEVTRTKPSVFVQLYAINDVYTQSHQTIQLAGYNRHFRANWFYGVYGFKFKLICF
jgi:hypothetical protein